jgi:hypothetical protein
MLSEFTLAELLQLFAISEKSGTITISHGRGESRLLVEAGKVVGWGLDDFDVHGAVLACKFLSPSSVSALKSIEPEPGTPGLAFVVRNLVDPERWTGFVQRLLEQDIYTVLGLEDGEFEITVDRIPPVPLGLDLSAQQLILDGSRWEADSAELAQEGYGLNSGWVRNITSNPQPGEELSQLDWLILSALVEASTIGRVAAAICQPDLDTADGVKSLHLRGLVMPATF